MLNIISFLLAAFALLLAIPAALPFLGWANWIIIPIALVGVLFGQLSDKRSGRNFSLVVLAICVIRLWLGGGLF